AAVLGVGDALLHIVDAEAFDPWCRSLEIARFVAVELDEGGAVMERLLLSLHLAQKVGHADLHAAVAADVELVARIDADHAEVLDRRLGAIARAARHRDFELMGHPAAPGHL